jgi:hypothetical protein
MAVKDTDRPDAADPTPYGSARPPHPDDTRGPVAAHREATQPPAPALGDWASL